MHTSPFDPKVKQLHSRMQSAVLLALRFPKSIDAEREQHLEEDAEYAEKLDAATIDDDYDIWSEEGFVANDEIL